MMLVPDSDLSNLLEYNAEHKLLICRKCRYAIQKSAVDSHLLRHKIYRKERKRLLQLTAQFDLLEPHLVQSPPPGAPAISALPVSSGFRCGISDCGHLTVSAKRMQKHWSDFHGPGNTVPALSSFSHAVKLQSFFRGTQNRYFEVTVPAEATLCLSKEDRVRHNSVPSPALCTKDPLDPVNLHALRYLHHFSTVTYSTLPVFNQLRQQDYWLQYVLPLALEQQWLMSGVLAITAFHKAFQADDIMNANEHIERTQTLVHHFKQTFDSLKSSCSADNLEVRMLGSQIEALLKLAEHTSPASKNIDVPLSEHLLTAIIEAVETCAPVTDFRTPASSDEAAIPVPGVLNYLHTLPGRFANILGKPDDPDEVFVILSAIAVLIDCCEDFSMKTSTWEGISRWAAGCPQQFKDLLSRSNPAALIVTAYWFATLVKPSEKFWYLQDLTETAIETISLRFLDAKHYQMLPLIHDLRMVMDQ